jgi:hypothetical protein
MVIHGGSHSAFTDRRRGFRGFGHLMVSAPLTTLDILDGVTVTGTTLKTITEDATLGWHSAGHLLVRGPGTYRFTFDVKFVGPSGGINNLFDRLGSFQTIHQTILHKALIPLLSK